MYICLGIVLTPEAVICAVNAHVEAINCYDDGENLCPFKSHSRGDTPLMHLLDCTFFLQGACGNFVNFLSKVCSTHLPFFTLS